MQRKVNNKISSLEYSSLLSIIENIIIGLESIKKYNYISQDILKSIEVDTKYIKDCYFELISKLRLKSKSNLLEEEDIRKINSIFNIEYKYKLLVTKIWEKELSNIDSIDQNSKFLTLIHIVKDKENINYVENVIYGNDIKCISTSLISNDKQFFYDHDKTSYGFIYEINENNFLGACESDAQIIQINDNLEHSVFTLISNNSYTINSIVYTYDKNYQMTLTKTPEALLNPVIQNNDLFYNEVCLDKNYSRPIGIIFYQKEGNEEIKEKVDYFSNKYNLPVIVMNLSQKLI